MDAKETLSPAEIGEKVLAFHNGLRGYDLSGPQHALTMLLAELVDYAEAHGCDLDKALSQGREVAADCAYVWTPADPLDAPAATAVLRCVDSMGNTAFVRRTAQRGWACTLSNGIPAAMSYAGVPHGEETATVVALERAKTVRDVLRIMKARAQQARSVELEG
jgi:hypothetical protein